MLEQPCEEKRIGKGKTSEAYKETLIEKNSDKSTTSVGIYCGAVRYARKKLVLDNQGPP